MLMLKQLLYDDFPELWFGALVYGGRIMVIKFFYKLPAVGVFFVIYGGFKFFSRFIL